MGNDKNDLEEGMTYRDAGVDIKKADELVGKIKQSLRQHLMQVSSVESVGLAVCFV